MGSDPDPLADDRLELSEPQRRGHRDGSHVDLPITVEEEDGKGGEGRCRGQSRRHITGEAGADRGRVCEGRRREEALESWSLDEVRVPGFYYWLFEPLGFSVAALRQ